MTSLADWLIRLLDHGEVVLSGPPVGDFGSDAAAIGVLSRAFESWKLEVAGPPIGFDSAASVSAAHYLAAACWSLVGQEPESDQIKLPSLGEPGTPSAHLSADITLRYLPTVYRRAAVRAHEDPLAAELAIIMRRWPLSGVLADLTEAPIGDLNFGGHHGLQLLYAERLIEHESVAWVPSVGATLERVELVYSERAMPLPKPAPPALESKDE